MPSTSTSGTGSPQLQLAAGAVEVGPLRPVAHDGLEVLLPDDPVLDRVLHDRAEQAGGDVVGPDRPVAEVRGERDSPLVMTEIASAVDSVADGDLIVVRRRR